MNTTASIDLDKALAKYQHYASLAAVPGTLESFYDDYDFTDLCVLRAALADLELSDEQSTMLTQIDKQLKAAFTPDVLQLYADYFPAFPVREWWG